MTDINRVVLVGRLTRDMTFTATPSGYPIGTVSLAINKSRKTDGQWKEEAHFFDVKILGKQAESLQPYLNKGTQIAVEGSLSQERWETQEGKRSKVVIVANQVQLLGGKKQANRPWEEPQAPPEKFQDDIPF